jgi:hypothetical protein
MFDHGRTCGIWTQGTIASDPRLSVMAFRLGRYRPESFSRQDQRMAMLVRTLLLALLAAMAVGCRSNDRPGVPHPRLQDPEATPVSQLYSS